MPWPKLISSQSTFAVLKIAGDASCLPLKPAIEALEQAYNSAKKVSIYQGQTAALMLKCDQVLIVIRDNTGNVDGTKLNTAINRTIAILVEIELDMGKWSNSSTWRRWLERHEYEEKLLAYEDALQQCVENLGLAAALEGVSRLGEVKDMIKEDQQNLKNIGDKVDQVCSRVTELQSVLVSSVPGSAIHIAATTGLIDISTNPEPYVLRPSNLEGEVTRIGDQPSFCGSTYDTYKGLWLGKYIVAMKVLRGPVNVGMRHKDIQRFERQINLWRTMKHKHVLDLIGYCRLNGDQMCLVSPWMENRDVAWYLHKTPDANRFQLITDVATGLEYLHSIRILHGNLKTSKIFVAHGGHALLAGFGLSKLLQHEKPTFYTQSDGPVSEFRYQPPEVVSGQPLNTSSDVYSWAMCALEIMTGYQPFFYLKPVGPLIKAINDHQFPTRSNYPSPALEKCVGLWELFEACCDGDPTKRPTISQVLAQLEKIKSQSAA